MPWGPDQIQPESTEVDSANKLVRIHARYTQAQCARVGLGFERLPLRIASKTLDTYAGRYVFGKYEITVYRKQDKLFAESSYGKGELQPLAETEFGIVNSTNGSYGKYTFRTSGNGKVSYMVFTGNGRQEEYRKVE